MDMAKTKIRFDLPVQLSYHILQLAKLRMLHFRFACLKKYCGTKDLEYLEMDTNSGHMWLAGKSLDDMVLPDKRNLLHHKKVSRFWLFRPPSEFQRKKIGF